MQWLALLRSLFTLMDRLITFANFRSAVKAGRDAERLRHERESNRRAQTAARARTGFRRAIADEPERLRDNDGYRRD